MIDVRLRIGSVRDPWINLGKNNGNLMSLNEALAAEGEQAEQKAI